jgi:hypothetical protein
MGYLPSDITRIEYSTAAIEDSDDAPISVRMGLTTGHAFVQITLSDGSTLYYDNGFFGNTNGEDHRFELSEVPDYARLHAIPAPNLLERCADIPNFDFNAFADWMNNIDWEAFNWAQYPH